MATERDTVYLLPTSTKSCHWRWLAPGADALVEGELTELQRFLAPLSPRPTLTLLLPAEAVLTTTVPVPSHKPQHIRAAVPNLVEEWLADELEDLHIATGERDTQSEVAVAAITRSTLQAWLAMLAAAGLRPDSAVIDTLRLPWQPGEISLAVQDGRVLLRWGDYHAGAVPLTQLTLLLSQLLTHWPASADRPGTLALYLSAADVRQIPELLTESVALVRQRHHLALRKQAMTGELTAWLCRIHEARSLELLQGAFAPHADGILHWRRWRPTAYAACTMVALQILLNIGAGFWLNQRAAQWRDQSTTLYRELFPGDRRVVNLRQQLQNHLDQADTGTASPFLTLFSRLAGAIQISAGESPLHLRSLTFEAGSGQLVVELTAPSVAAIDVMQKHLQAQGVSTTILSAINESEHVVGRLRLRANPR